MSSKNKFIYLDDVSPEFRKGYDVANVIFVIKNLLKEFYENNTCKKTHINIHKDNLSECQGLCAENLFHSEINAPKNNLMSKDENEVWLLITPSKMITD